MPNPADKFVFSVNLFISNTGKTKHIGKKQSGAGRHVAGEVFARRADRSQVKRS